MTYCIIFSVTTYTLLGMIWILIITLNNKLLKIRLKKIRVEIDYNRVAAQITYGYFQLDWLLYLKKSIAGHSSCI